MEYLVPAVIVAGALVAAALIVVAWLGRGGRRGEPDAAMAVLQNQVSTTLAQTTARMDALQRALTDSLQTLGTQMARTVAESTRTVGDRLDSTGRLIGDVRQQLGQLEQSSRRMLELGQDISKLQEILQPPKLRGALGELFLADLLAQVLPASHYRLQHRFKGGETVDAAVVLHAGIVPIDAKFPLENFRRILSGANEDERKTARRAFVKDIRGHIDAIASKYIRPDENTFDFALMYVPAENVYYETIIKDTDFGGELTLFGYAIKKRVIPVSPNSFYAYLQTIVLGLKGMQVEERSREILENLSRLDREIQTFAESFRVVGQHLDNSMKKYAEAQKRFDKVEAKIAQIDGLAKGVEGADGNRTLPASEERAG